MILSNLTSSRNVIFHYACQNLAHLPQSHSRISNSAHPGKKTKSQPHSNPKSYNSSRQVLLSFLNKPAIALFQIVHTRSPNVSIDDLAMLGLQSCSCRVYRVVQCRLVGHLYRCGGNIGGSICRLRVVRGSGSRFCESDRAKRGEKMSRRNEVKEKTRDDCRRGRFGETTIDRGRSDVNI